jgi:hypothetical protein
MPETGVPKFVSAKTITYIIGAIVLVIAILIAFNYIKQVFGEFIDVPKEGEKARFMRYMTCALAMCTARNIKGASACTSTDVMDLALEYDEEGNVVKSCQEACQEMESYVQASGSAPIPQEHYCEKVYHLTYTFQDTGVTYKGNYDIPENIVDRLREEISCKDMKGHQTDVSCLQNWRRFIECGCLRCTDMFNFKVWNVYPEGKIALRDTESNGLGYEFGSIYIDESLQTSGKITCVPEDVGFDRDDPSKTNGQGECTFPPGLNIVIWAENTGTVLTYCIDLQLEDVTEDWPILHGNYCGFPPFGWCGGLENVGCDCQVIGIDES